MTLRDQVLQTLGVHPPSVDFGRPPTDPEKTYRYNGARQRIEFREYDEGPWRDSENNFRYQLWKQNRFTLHDTNSVTRWLFLQMGQSYTIADRP